jgi:hypothetical protein
MSKQLPVGSGFVKWKRRRGEGNSGMLEKWNVGMLEE